MPHIFRLNEQILTKETLQTVGRKHKDLNQELDNDKQLSSILEIMFFLIIKLNLQISIFKCKFCNTKKKKKSQNHRVVRLERTARGQFAQYPCSSRALFFYPPFRYL